MAGGRPSKYNDEILATARDYIVNFADYDELRQRFPVHKVLRYQQGEYGVAVAKGKNNLLAFIFHTI